jgi:hypothetical protein
MPKIDFDSYDPKTRYHKNSTFTATSTFERTSLFDRNVRKNIIDEKTYDNDSESFIRDNMNKWPVIFINMHSVKFDSPSPSLSEIKEKLCKNAVRQAFKEHEDVLFAKMVEEACSFKYKRINRETYLRLLKDHKIDDNKDLSSRIEILWVNYGKEMDLDVQDFYRFYKGMPPYDYVADSLKLLSKILHGFYQMRVIVLVDDHDTPALHLYSGISLDRHEDNAKIIESIQSYSETITHILDNVAKYNQNLERFLMSGVTNSVIDIPYSAFNNLKVYDSLDSEYSEFFSLSKQEINETVNFLFNETSPEPKKQIMLNIDRWYNGYFRNESTPMYSIFSTGQYLNACFGEYCDRQIHPSDTSCAWIPKPEKYWAKSNLTNIFNNYMNLGFKGKLTYTLKKLVQGLSVGLEQGFVPLLMDPSDPPMREKIISHLLLQCGFLVGDGTESYSARIPNFELMHLFQSQLDSYLSRHPISNETISILSKSLLDQDYTAFGEEVMKSLHVVHEEDANTTTPSERNKRRGNEVMPEHYPLEIHIHRLMWKIFSPMTNDKIFLVRRERGGKEKLIRGKKIHGYYINFIFSPMWADGNFYYVLELNTEGLYMENLRKCTLVGLKQIFDQKYHRDLLPIENTKAIINVGIAANDEKLSIGIFKTNINNGEYQSADKLLYQEFSSTKSANDTISVSSSNVTEAEIDIFHCLKQDVGKDSNITNAGISINCTEVTNDSDDTNNKVRKTISLQLEDLIENPSKFNDTGAQTNAAAGSTT